MWHSPVRRQPTWEPPTLDEFGDPAWTGYMRYKRVVRTMVQEIVENIFDTPHGQFVHANAHGTAPAQATFTFDHHVATADFRLDVPLVGGKTQHLTTVHGPGITVNRSTGQGSKSFYTTYTPVDQHTVETNFSFMTPCSQHDDPTGERSLASVAATTKLFEQDIPIWEHKILPVDATTLRRRPHDQPLPNLGAPVLPGDGRRGHNWRGAGSVDLNGERDRRGPPFGTCVLVHDLPV